MAGSNLTVSIGASGSGWGSGRCRGARRVRRTLRGLVRGLMHGAGLGSRLIHSSDRAALYVFVDSDDVSAEAGGLWCWYFLVSCWSIVAVSLTVLARIRQMNRADITEELGNLRQNTDSYFHPLSGYAFPTLSVANR